MSSSTLDSSSQPQHTLSPTEALWAHVLRKDRPNLQPKKLDMPQIPVAPIDRNATSTRILLYDTQARLEQFSSRADAMLKGVQEAGHQLKSVGMLFEKDRDTLTNDIIDLVNRSQTEIQKTVGQPAQEPQFSAFQEKLELRLEGLNQRVDALQMFHQTHCQALETHSQILKSIQDQQNALLSALLPLLPLLQGFPSQFEQMRSGIQEANEAMISRVTDLKQDMISSVSHIQTASASCKRRFSGPSTSYLTSKRLRTGSPGSPSPNPATSDNATLCSRPQQSPPKALPPDPICPTGIVPLKLDIGRAARQRSVFATPRHKSKLQLPDASVLLPRTKPPTSLFRGTTSPIQKMVPTVPSTPSNSVNQSISSNALETPSRILSPTSKNPALPLVSARTFRGQSPIEVLPQRPNSASLASSGPKNPTVVPFLRPTFPKSLQATSVVDTDGPSGQSKPTTLSLPPGLSFQPTPSFVVRNQTRDRRSPLRDGRRFIPLEDDDDDDDN